MKDCTIVRASVAPVEMGNLVIQGLMTELGVYCVGVPQICDLFADEETFKTSRNTASRDLKRLLGKDFKTSKVKTEFNRNLTAAVSLTDFERVLRKLDRAGNKVAQGMVDDLVGLSLHQLFCDAFEVEFDKRDRQELLKTRQLSKQAFWSLGDAIKSYKETHSEKSDNYRRFIYSNCQDCLNRGLFGKDASTIRTELGVPDLLRDHYGQASLKRIELVQSLAAANIVHRDIEPLDAVKQALAMYSFGVVNYKE